MTVPSLTRQFWTTPEDGCDLYALPRLPQERSSVGRAKEWSRGSQAHRLCRLSGLADGKNPHAIIGREENPLLLDEIACLQVLRTGKNLVCPICTTKSTI